jgi:hypothetical protein
MKENYMSFLPLKRTVLAFGASFVVALLVAACGGGDDSKPTTVNTANATASGNTNATTAPTNEPETTTSDSGGSNTTGLVDNGDGVACPLVTTAQVSEAIGKPMQDGVGQGGDGAYDVCDWTAVSGTPSVTLNFYKQDAQQYYDIVLGEPTDVPGIGDKARWTPGRLEVLQGNYYFTVFVSIKLGTPDAELLAAAKAVAGNVLASLP